MKTATKTEVKAAVQTNAKIAKNADNSIVTLIFLIIVLIGLIKYLLL